MGTQIAARNRNAIMVIDRGNRNLTSKLEVDPPGDLKRRKVPVLESMWRNTSESHTDKLDQTNMDFSHTDEFKIQNNIFNQYYIFTNG